jgi:hypothetical protein
MTKTVQELVHEQVAAKIEAGEALQAAVATAEEQAAVLAEAEAEAARSRRAALKAGWTESELKSLGLASKTRTRRRPAATPAGTADAAPEDTTSGTGEGDQ